MLISLFLILLNERKNDEKQKGKTGGLAKWSRALIMVKIEIGTRMRDEGLIKLLHETRI